MDDGRALIEIENIKSDITELKEKCNQHDKEIINLKESNIELKIYVKQIFEKIDEVKAMIQIKKEEKQEKRDGEDSNDRLDKFIDIMLETFQNNNKNENEIKVNSNKQKWIIIGSIITALCSILVAVFK